MLVLLHTNMYVSVEIVEKKLIEWITKEWRLIFYGIFILNEEKFG